MQVDQDTIVAISTPAGRGGIGVVRISGPQARAIAGPFLNLRKPLSHGQARFTYILDEQGQGLDEAVVTFFAAPHSYTSEDVVEISAHGAPVLLDYILRASIANGARLAEPGEFTQRSFLSGRLDLTQAEAVNDLIAAQTLHQARTAAAQLGGSIARSLAPAKHSLVSLIAALEAGVDFAEDDLDLLPEAEIATRLDALIAALEAMSKTYAYGRILHEGAKLAIVGRPNAGKSSLFNRLLERERAIVTAQPGTTRDPISEQLALAGIPIELVDTAGLREVAASLETEAEREGILRSRATMAEADLVLHVLDASVTDASTIEGSLSTEDTATQNALAGRPSLLILNKCDLNPAPLAGALQVSALTGQGLEQLKQAILDRLAAQPSGDSVLITNLRQSQALGDALGSLATARIAAAQAIPHEFLLLDLHRALDALDRLTGATAPDDILQLIFSTFCIGK